MKNKEIFQKRLITKASKIFSIVNMGRWGRFFIWTVEQPLLKGILSSAKLKGASPLTLYEVDEIIENISINSPTTTKETISIAVEAVLNIESSKNGQELLVKLAQLTEEEDR